MRFLLLLILSLVVSCGQNTSKKSEGKNDAVPQSNEEYITDIKEVDLLDVAMDVPIQISGNKIIFQESVVNSTSGVRSSCSVGVNSGDAYHYQFRGANLFIKTPSGEVMNLKRLSGDSGLIGSWVSKVYHGHQLVMRRLTFISSNRLIMRTHCEG